MGRAASLRLQFCLYPEEVTNTGFHKLVNVFIKWCANGEKAWQLWLELISEL